jgi:hypothetical protein
MASDQNILGKKIARQRNVKLQKLLGTELLDKELNILLLVVFW